MAQRITAWISIGSTYTFLTALRLGKIIESEKLDIVFKPFSARNIMREMNNIPFPPEKKTKVNYMWRDIERRAQVYGISTPKMPAPYPLKDFDLTNKIAIVANQERWYMT